MVTVEIILFKENPHGRTGSRTRDLVISSQKLWPLDHEAGLCWHRVDFCKFSHRFDRGIGYECRGLREVLSFVVVGVTVSMHIGNDSELTCIGRDIVTGISSHPRPCKWSNYCVLILEVFTEYLRCNQACIDKRKRIRFLCIDKRKRIRILRIDSFNFDFSLTIPVWV
jgi:hypothetical protein